MDKMKTLNEFLKLGYKFLAYGSNEHIGCYIAIVKGRKVYGYFDYEKERYIEESYYR